MTDLERKHPMYTAIRRLSKAVTGARMSFFAHHNILSNRIHTLEKRQYELNRAFQLANSQLIKEIHDLKEEFEIRGGNLRNQRAKTSDLQ